LRAQGIPGNSVPACRDRSITIKALIVDDAALAASGCGNPAGLAPGRGRSSANCSGGRDAVDAIGEAKPDLVFLDVHDAPTWTPFEVLEEVRPEATPGRSVRDRVR